MTEPGSFAEVYAREVFGTVEGYIDHIRGLTTEEKHQYLTLSIPLHLIEVPTLLVALQYGACLTAGDFPEQQELMADLAQSVMCQATAAQRSAARQRGQGGEE